MTPVQDRWLAALCWGGWCLGGPLPALVILATAMGAKDSRRFRHARVAVTMWAIAIAIWIPVFIAGIAMRPTDPAPVTVGVGIALGGVTLLCSLVGFLGALVHGPKGDDGPSTAQLG